MWIMCIHWYVFPLCSYELHQGVPRSVDVERNALSYAVMGNKLEMIQYLIDLENKPLPDNKERCLPPTVALNHMVTNNSA